MNKYTLLVLAAGMGSRFGGLKQIEPVGPNGEFLLDYAIYDAIEAGFNKVVFIIKEENYEIFKNTIGRRIENKIEVQYAFQDFKGLNMPQSRVKPLGTTHAILCAKDYINEPFIIINGDDYYGKESYADAMRFLKETNNKKQGLVLYNLKNTLSKSGEVKRGICVTKNDKLIRAIECKVEKVNNELRATSLTTGENILVDNNTLTSLNMFILLPEIFPMLEEVFKNFLEENKNNLDNCEALIIEDLFKLIKNKKIEINTIVTKAKWFGMTYKEDKDEVIRKIKTMIEKKEYPSNLWS